MSYEILLYPRTPGQDWDEVVAADEADGPEVDLPTLNRGIATFRRIEAKLREQLTEPVRTWVAEETDGDIFGELRARDSKLRVDLYDRSASVSFPYGGPDSPVHDLARTAIDIVAAETGYEAYDPQVRAGFGGSFDDDAGQESLSRESDEDDLWAADEAPGDDEGYAASSGATAAPLEGRVVDDGDQEHPTDPKTERERLIEERRQQIQERRRNPAFMRRRGWLYVIIGVILTGIGLMRLSGGDGGFLTWLVLGIGVFDLLGGWFMFSLSKRMEQRPAGDQDGAPVDGPDGASGPQDDGPDNDGIQRL